MAKSFAPYMNVASADLIENLAAECNEDAADAGSDGACGTCGDIGTVGLCCPAGCRASFCEVECLIWHRQHSCKLARARNFAFIECCPQSSGLAYEVARKGVEVLPSIDCQSALDMLQPSARKSLVSNLNGYYVFWEHWEVFAKTLAWSDDEGGAARLRDDSHVYGRPAVSVQNRAGIQAANEFANLALSRLE